MIRVFNTLGRRKEVFTPHRPPLVGMYVCGPTVYDYTHIGHARTFTVFDAVKRYLRLRGFDVFHVQNITDIDDKIINRAREEGRDWRDVVEEYSRDYFEGLRSLGIQIDHHPRVTDHIPDIIRFVHGLIEKGYAYVAESGSVYFEVDKYPGYGMLSGSLSKEAWRQEEDVMHEKKSPYDFALWKAAKPGEPSWESPWGRGRPGWHIECSVMSSRYLGSRIDIHGGGVDLVFPHHENERAQSESYFGHRWVKYWLHASYLTIKGEKMSKSLGNIIPLREALREWGPGPLRLWLLSSHYRSNLDYSEEALGQYRRLYERLRQAADSIGRRLERAEPSGRLGDNELETLAKLKRVISGWHEAMSDDFNMGKAMSSLWEFTTTYFREVEQTESYTLLWLSWRILTAFNSVYAFSPDIMESRRPEKTLEDSLVQALVDVRSELRKRRMYDLADDIRNRLAELGFILHDMGEKTEWRRK
ncbi:cysteine--tRNA ligase [Aeropyrum camini]|uniref:Cysteine--tRNA ligase n=1 Tax=Aeropyrum camini SY1 = JCM 12091 TaxID=1198449 RepID=U3TES6_9CREN|nr:cysteine--tRNA ligase [Aeropyrum camini]BAN90468.1 cysteinyl-tRNA synthetase [Aeropyrum camini SY1 = JCM 12091]